MKPTSTRIQKLRAKTTKVTSKVCSELIAGAMAAIHKNTKLIDKYKKKVSEYKKKLNKSKKGGRK